MEKHFGWFRRTEPKETSQPMKKKRKRTQRYIFAPPVSICKGKLLKVFIKQAGKQLSRYTLSKLAKISTPRQLYPYPRDQRKKQSNWMVALKDLINDGLIKEVSNDTHINYFLPMHEKTTASEYLSFIIKEEIDKTPVVAKKNTYKRPLRQTTATEKKQMIIDALKVLGEATKYKLSIQMGISTSSLYNQGKYGSAWKRVLKSLIASGVIKKDGEIYSLANKNPGLTISENVFEIINREASTPNINTANAIIQSFTAQELATMLHKNITQFNGDASYNIEFKVNNVDDKIITINYYK